MTTTVEAIYENGSLKLSRPLPLEEKAQVLVTVQTKAELDVTNGSETPLEALQRLRKNTRLTRAQTEEYLREVKEERLASDGRRPA